MDTKNNIFGALGGVVIGIVVGYLVWGGTSSETHLMPDGTVMNDETMMSMEAMMDGMMAELDGKTGDEFDRAFIQEMIIHHKGAVAMAESARTNAKHDEVKSLAEAIIKAQNEEIAKMEMWMKDWYGE